MSSDTHPYAEAMSKALAQCHADWKAADRKRRINELAARYAGQLMAGDIAANNGWKSPGSIAADARALAAAVVEAEE